MRKIYLTVTFDLIINADESVPIDDITEDLFITDGNDYEVAGQEMTNYEVNDSK